MSRETRSLLFPSGRGVSAESTPLLHVEGGSLPPPHDEDDEEDDSRRHSLLRPFVGLCSNKAFLALVLIAFASSLTLMLGLRYLYGGTSAPHVSQSPLDKRTYSYVELLENSLPVLLVCDASLTSAAAAMSVHVGFYNDPSDIPGLAHFTEHELFAGSQKYPDEQAFFQFILENGGRANAYTKEEETNFYFRVQSHALETALDYFSQFFIAPKFGRSRISREMHAIEAEHRMRTNNDDRRRYEILALCSSPLSPLHHYGTGSLDTLNRTDIREQLQQFHAKFYSANRLRLTIIGPQPISKLAKLAQEYFAAVPNRHLPDMEYSALPFDERSLVGHVVYIEPVLDSHIITIYWQLPAMQKSYLADPSGYVALLMSHKSEGSLQYWLQSQGWITFLTASPEVDASAFMLFHVRVGLTNTGLSNVDFIIETIYDWIHEIKVNGIRESVENERIAIERIRFIYDLPPEISTFASVLSSRMQTRSIEDLLLSPERRKFDAGSINLFLSYLDPLASLLLISSANFTHGMFLDAAVEKYYDIPYKVQTLPESLRNRWSRVFHMGYYSKRDFEADHFSLLLPTPNMIVPSPSVSIYHDRNLSIPQPNPFIDIDMSHPSYFRSSTKSSSASPIKLRENHNSRTWLRVYTDRKLPRVKIGIEIRSPLLTTMREQALCQLFAAIITDQFTSVGYQAQLAGYVWSVEAVPSALRIIVSGLKSKIEEVVMQLLDRVTLLNVNAARFATVKARLLERRDNIFLSMQPFEHCLYLAQLITEQNKFADHLITDAATYVQLDDVLKFRSHVLHSSFAEALFFGDIDEKQSLWIVDSFIKQFNTTGPHSNDIVWRHEPASRVYLIPPGNYLYQYPFFKANHNVNAATYVSIFASSYHRVRHSTVLKLLRTLIQPFCFDRLRSNLQLGYIVRCFTTIHFNTVQSFDVLVQGSEHDAAEMDEQIELMIEDFGTLLHNMSRTEFEAGRKAARRGLMQPSGSMESAFINDWSHIVGLDHDFHRASLEAVEMSDVTQQEVCEFYRLHILANPSRRRLSVEIFGKDQTSRLPSYGAAPSAVITDDNRIGKQESWRIFQHQSSEHSHSFGGVFEKDKG